MSFVYVITNEWCPGLSKLGATTNINERFQDLSSVLPGNSDLRWFRQVDDCFVVESLARLALSDFIINRSNDWLNCPYEIVIDQMESIIDRQSASLVVKKMETKSSAKIDEVGNLGFYCRGVRSKQGITQAQLAELSGTGVRFISEFENGKATCEIGKVLRVANTLGVDLYAVRRPEE